MRVLITGGCGFVGTNLVARLNADGGHQVRVFDNESLGKREFLADLDVEFVHGDLRDADAIAAAVEGMDVVVHLAADTRVIPSIENPRHNFDANVVGTINLLEAMRATGVKRLVNASTGGAILGEIEPPVHEEMVPHPLSPYGASKLAVEGYSSAYCASYGFKIVSLRFSNVYGPRSFHKGSVVALYFRQILKGETLTVFGDGSQTRDYVYVVDLVDGIVRAMSAEMSGVYQLGTGIGTPLNDLIQAIRETVGNHAVDVRYEAFREGEIRHTWCDVSRARQAFGYDPSTTLQEGLDRTWRWFCAHR